MGSKDPFYFGNAAVDQAPPLRVVCRSVHSGRVWTAASDGCRTEMGHPPGRRKAASPLGQSERHDHLRAYRRQLEDHFPRRRRATGSYPSDQGRLRRFRARGCPLLGGRWRHDRSLCALSISRGRITNGNGLRKLFQACSGVTSISASGGSRPTGDRRWPERCRLARRLYQTKFYIAFSALRGERGPTFTATLGITQKIGYS